MATSHRHGSPMDILLVDDSPSDRLLTADALEAAPFAQTLHVVENGVDALAYLRREGRFSTATRPDLIMLDLNLPKKDGREVLEEIKTDPDLKTIPVVVLSTSMSDEDVQRAYRAHANSYITKPVGYTRFHDVMAAVEKYWLGVVTLPPPPDPARRIARASSTSPVGESRVRVLLVEDSPTDVLLFRDAAAGSTQYSFEITVAARLAEALDLLETGTFDVVLTDLGLPDSQGLEALRLLRSRSGDVPIIVLTGLDDELTGVSALHEGAQDYLVKGELSERGLARAVRYAIDKRLIQNQLRLSQRMEAIGQLAGGIAHDVNNMLTIIQSNAQVISEATDPVMIAESAKEIQEATVRGARLTRQLLTFSQRGVMTPRPLNLWEVIDGFDRMLRRILGETIRLDIRQRAAIPVVDADIGMIEQVLLNLAVNARDAMPAGGNLIIRLASVSLTAAEAKLVHGAYPGTFVCLAVEDTGSGIAPEHLPHIWDPFFTTKDVGKGTGIGLATVYSIADQHRGWIQARSTLGVGTTFELFLPVSSVPPIPATPETLVICGAETILYAEDDSKIRGMVARLLEAEGYRVMPAATGIEALALWHEHGDRIDLLLTDMMMPEGMHGDRLAAKLTAVRPDLPVVFLSGYSPEFGRGLVLEEGVNFLYKPFSIGDLLRTVRASLDRTKASR